MKSFFAIASLLTVISLACTSKSAGSQPTPNNTRAAEVRVEPTMQEKPPCSLKLAAAPTINGLRLGMTADEVLGLFPGSKDDSEVATQLARRPNAFGGSSLVIHPSKYGSKDTYAGIQQISFMLLDGVVWSFNIGYAGPEYSDVDKFVDVVVKNSNLPPTNQWQPYVGMDNQLKILSCDEFEVRVFAGGQGGNLNYVAAKDLVADKKLKDRRAKAAAQATPTP